MSERQKILILGGTREAAALAAELSEQGHDVTTSLAGRTKEPAPLAGKTRTGGFSRPGVVGQDGLAEFLLENGFDRLIDATHPFAVRISANARIAAEQVGIPLEVRTRKPWRKTDGDNWFEVASINEAVQAIPPGARVLLALGSQHIGPFAQRNDVFFLVRMVDAPGRKLPIPDFQLLLEKPATGWEKEAEVIRENRITHIVCRNSGGEGAYAKIEAARHLGLTVIMISQQ